MIFYVRIDNYFHSNVRHSLYGNLLSKQQVSNGRSEATTATMLDELIQC